MTEEIYEPVLDDEDSNVKYPHITVNLSESNGNAFFILGRVGKALRRAGVPNSEIEQFYDEAKSGDYDDLLQTCMRWVDCE